MLLRAVILLMICGNSLWMGTSARAEQGYHDDNVVAEATPAPPSAEEKKRQESERRIAEEVASVQQAAEDLRDQDAHSLLKITEADRNLSDEELLGTVPARRKGKQK